MPYVPDEGDTAKGAKAPFATSTFESQILALLPSLRRYSRSLTRSDSDGEDLLQDSIVKALSNRRQWRGLNLRAWVFTIMTNLNRNHYRARAAENHVELEAACDLSAESSNVDPIEGLRLRRALDRLNPEHRSVLMLVVVEGYSYSEVAAMLEIPMGTVMSRLSRARERLGTALADDNVVTLRRPK